MDAVRQVITVKKAELDRLRGVASVGPTNLEQVYDVELTYKSNAIEGNTVTASETMQVIEHRITVSGKPLKDHLEAIDHFEVIRCVRDLAR
jgi:Fic family protein